MKRKTVLKRTLACCLAVILMLTGVPLASISGIDPANFKDFFSFEASAATWENLTYEVSNGEATIIDCDESISGKFVIPATLGGYPVTSIFCYAFEDCTGLTSITIPNSVTSILDDAFAFCTGLTSVTIPNSVTSIGEHVFYSCTRLAKITVSSSNTVYHSTDNCLIETKTKTLISGCKSSVIPTDGSVRSIGRYAFLGFTGLKSITIPDSITSIGDCAFQGCTGLTSVKIPDSVTSIGWGAFQHCTGLTSITIPYGVISIGDYTFRDCTGLTSITIPDSVTSIGDEAFSYCSGLTSVTIGNSVTSIGCGAFDDCTGLTSITIPDSVTSIGYCAFYGCTGLTDVYYTGSEADWNKISIGENNSPLTSATIHYSVNFKIGDNAGKTNISFNQSWFTQDSLNYNHNLARLTSQFAMLGYAKKSDLENALKAIGFNVEDNYVDLNTSRDEVNYFIASKKIEINGKTVNLIFAGFIGSHKKQWNSNFDPYGYKSTTTYADKKVLKGKVHLGFNDAKNFVYNKLEQYVKDNSFTKENTKILLTGHSRGAATADLVAAKLIDEQNLVYPKNLYTYTFATPNSAKSSITKSNSEYKRIFNIINPEDFVVKVLPTAWKFDKFGTTYVLPSKTNSSDTIRYFRARMEKKYAEFGAGTFHGYSDGEKQPNNIVTKMTGTVHNLDEFYSKELKYTVVGGTKLSMYEYFQYTLCPFVNKSPEDSVEYKNARNLAIGFIATDVPGFYIFKPITWFFLKNNMISPNFKDAHRMETYCAYMMTMSSAQVEAERHSTLNTVNCPVDIEVYEKTTGELVGKITNNVIDEAVAAKENAIVMGVDGDSKSFWLPSDEEYEVKLIGNDEGTMDYSVESIDSDLGETERVNFFDVEITDGLTMTGEMKIDTALEDYSLEYDNGNKLTPTETLSGDEITSYNINVSVEGNGYATESVTASSGDYVTVNAMETVGNSTDGWYIFDGWYENEEKVSSERSFSFVAKGNRNLTAKFVWSDVCLHPQQEELIEIPATCTESGNEPGVFCMMCETYLSGGKEIPALGHDIVTDIEAVRPTCTENGRTLGGNCARCEYCLESEVVPATGHAEETISAVAPTCNELGYTAGTKCSVCGEILIKQEEIPALGHDLVIDVEAKEAICTQSGTTEGVHCIRCDYKVEAVEIKPLGHADEDNDGNCDRCGEKAGEPVDPPKPDDPSATCTHICHKGGISAFFYKIVRFFWKLFKTNKYCSCGAAHY